LFLPLAASRFAFGFSFLPKYASPQTLVPGPLPSTTTYCLPPNVLPRFFFPPPLFLVVRPFLQPVSSVGSPPHPRFNLAKGFLSVFHPSPPWSRSFQGIRVFKALLGPHLLFLHFSVFFFFVVPCATHFFPVCPPRLYTQWLFSTLSRFPPPLGSFPPTRWRPPSHPTVSRDPKAGLFPALKPPLLDSSFVPPISEIKFPRTLFF